MTNDTPKSPAHTPGPWRTDWLGDDRDWILDGNANYIAEIVAEDECGFVVPREQRQANARLIAAAPKLLRRCQMCLADAEAALALPEEVAGYDWRSIADDLREVIDRATGQAA